MKQRNTQTRRRGIMVRAALAAAAAATLASGTAAYAAPTVTDIQFHYVYTNAGTGDTFFNVMENRSDSTWKGRVLLQTKDGQWEMLPDEIAGLSQPIQSPYAAIYSQVQSLKRFDDAYYDPDSAELVTGSLYQNSPSGKWGLKYILHFDKFPAEGGYSKGYGYAKRVAVLLKNNQNGVIRQIGDLPFMPQYFWLPDGSLMEQRFSKEDRQNEIVRINPDNGLAKRLILGSLEAYSNGQNEILFARNESTRTPQIYDFRTGKTRLAGKNEANALMESYQSAQTNTSGKPDAPAVPADLDIDALPVMTTTSRQLSEANVLVDDKTISVPYSFFGLDSKLYVPIQPIAQALGWKVTDVPGNEYSFSIKTSHRELLADKTNSLMYNSRLFVRIDAIRAAGYTNTGIQWIQPADYHG
ncbi:hypothetical protein [Paenibacillus glycinis]|uniref:Copper amine oxidase-like N-terminal domain-containing protein n=1 Tax=Paenibacillus glycinis TaxID=2697035 RepID=A0ABW9XYV9_9BACL|nr:hypothetical protein [Paenibacillus glycinis]NBD27900.1 hypothetical protein [Paenibacillus glycinis]